MEIHGFQKMTLLDFPGKVACTVFTAGCNLRCPFCHNAFLVTEIDNERRFEKSEILEYINKRNRILDGVCITGGEPLLYPDTVDFLKEIKQTGLAVKLDTNGTFPERLKDAVRYGYVDYVAMDIKNSPEKYAQTVGIKNFDFSSVKESIEFLLSGKVDFEFRTTVVKQFHTAEDIEKIARVIEGAPRYFLQSFEDSGNLIGENMEPCSKEETEEMKRVAEKYVKNVEIRGK